MLLRQLIQTRMNSSFRIFDREGNLQSPEKIRSEYSHIRRFLIEMHEKDKSPVVISQTKDYPYLLTMLACMEIGIPYIPVTVDYPQDRFEQIKFDSKFQMVIDDTKVREIQSQPEGRHPVLPSVNPDSTVYVMFTSGSTGKPKGVTIPRRALENFFTHLRDCFPDVSRGDRILQVTEFTFDISLVDVGMFLVKDCELHFSQFSKDIFRLAYEIEKARITFLNTVPNNLNMFLSDTVAGRTNYQSLKHLFIAGGRFSYGLYNKCKSALKSDVNVYNFYGPTESTVYSHGHKLTFEESTDCVEQIVSIGKPLPGVTAEIVSAEGNICGPLEKGELHLGGVQLLKGYINNPEQTQKALVKINDEIFYKTGDLAFQKSSGRFFVIGRTDETIKHRGYRINLLDIDSYITRLPYVQDSVSIAIPDELTENEIVAFLILKEEKTVKEIKQDLRTLLLDFQIPTNIVFVKNYPTNDSGKVDRKVLRENYER